MKSICIIVNKYPNPIEPNALVFVQQLAWSMADKGVECSVICPLPININPRYWSFPEKKVEITENNNKVTIYQPKFIGFGQAHKIFGKSPAPLTTSLFTKAVAKIIAKMDEKPDVVYGHFVTPAGIAAARIGRKYNIPSFMAHGEATFKTINEFGPQKVKKELSTLSGIIAVSTQNKEMLLSVDAVKEDVIGIFPNGYRTERFFPRNKIESRKKYGFPQDKFIVGFVGSFDHRKGILRLEKAVEQMEDVVFACAGKGKLHPTSSKCIFSRQVENDELPYFYSALDLFVLPTLNEGCCNAIIEALACGLPVISSDLSFNYDILDKSCSILINPNKVDELVDAIKILKLDSEYFKTLSIGSLEKAKKLTINNRTSNILDFINSKMGMFDGKDNLIY